METTLSFRGMEQGDIEQVWQVEKEAFPTPWSREAFFNELTHNHFAHYVLAEVAGEIAGYCGMWIIVDEAHITNIAVRTKYRGRRIGEQLLRQMMELARWHGARRMTLEVRVSNKIAQNLYAKLGFKLHGVRPKYYTDNLEDAYIMWVDL